MARIEDLIDEASFGESADGIALVRKYIITDVNGTGDARLYAARQAMNMTRGDFHPSIPGIQVDTITIVPASNADNTRFKATVTYKALNSEEIIADDTQPAQMRVGTTAQQSTTNQDVGGNVIVLEHTYTDTDENGAQTKRKEEQVGEVEVYVPSTVFEFTRREKRDPSDKALFYNGKVNATPFRGDPAGLWLCTGITGESPDAGKTFNVTYSFQRRPDTWDAFVVFIDKDTNKPPKDLVEDVGMKYVQVYERVDFSPLRVD